MNSTVRSKSFILIFLILTLGTIGCKKAPNNSETESETEITKRFDKKNDLLLVQYDCKTDVDDLHSVAAFRTLISMPEYSNINYHAVAGTYGIQEGLYVPPNELFQMAFGENWSDAHTDRKKAIERVMKLALNTIDRGGKVWIAEAGQSDFSAVLIESVKRKDSSINTIDHFHIVQHSNWNEEVTHPDNLLFVQENTTYHKIADGNAEGNGTPGFNSSEFSQWNNYVQDPDLMKIWQTAMELGNKYNGREGRYLNESIAAGGLDFSDFSEVCWVMEIDTLSNGEAFFEFYSKTKE